MKKIIFLLFFILVANCQSIFAQDTTMTKAEMREFMKYNDEKKSEGTAIVLSILLPSAGHAYAGKWGTGLLFAAGEIGFLGLSYWAISEANGEYTAEDNVAIAGSCAIALILRVCEICDAANQVSNYNDNLRKNLSFGISPNKGGGVSYCMQIKF
jgi:hypothetical protein